jgi:polar amino acid transport system substrate-binding protein
MLAHRLWSLRLLALVALIACACTAHAQTPAQSLDTIIKRGKVLIGMDMSAPPFAYEDENQKPAGSEVQTAQLLAKDLGVELEIVPTSAANRIPYILTGRVDMMMGAFSIFPDRAKAIWFSSPYGSVTSVVLAPHATKITSYADLVGKKISVSRGTYTEQVLMAAVPSGAQIVSFDDDPQAMAALASGQVDAYGVGNVPGSMLVKRFPERQYEIKISIPPRNWYSIGVRPGDVDLLQWVNTFIFFHRENGDLKRIYESVIGDTLPPPPTL